MRSVKTVWIISFVVSFTCIGSMPFVRAQSAYTPIQFGHVHKPYGSDSDQQPYSTSPTSPNSSSSASSPSVTPSSSYTTPSSNYSSTSTTAPSSSHAYASPLKYSTSTSNPPSTSAQPAPEAPPPQTAVQDSPPQTEVQPPTQERQVGNFLRGVGNALRNTGVVNNGAYVNKGGYLNNGVYLNKVAPIGAFARNFSGNPTLVNGVPYVGGPLPSSAPAAQKLSISALKEDFPLPAGKDDLETFDNKQLAQRANGGWIQRHYIVGTEGGGIIGRHGPQWHVGGQN
jgi:hypothetical protein